MKTRFNIIFITALILLFLQSCNESVEPNASHEEIFFRHGNIAKFQHQSFTQQVLQENQFSQIPQTFIANNNSKNLRLTRSSNGKIIVTSADWEYINLTRYNPPKQLVGAEVVEFKENGSYKGQIICKIENYVNGTALPITQNISYEIIARKENFKIDTDKAYIIKFTVHTEEGGNRNPYFAYQVPAL